MNLGGAAVYEWEIDDLAAGPGIGWDLLNVEGTLAFGATPDSPWILEINELKNDLLLNSTEWLIASALTIDGFDPASIQVAWNSVGDLGRLPSERRFEVQQRGTDLYLVRTVPEPASLGTIALLCLMLSAASACGSNEAAEAWQHKHLSHKCNRLGNSVSPCSLAAEVRHEHDVSLGASFHLGVHTATACDVHCTGHRRCLLQQAGHGWHAEEMEHGQ